MLYDCEMEKKLICIWDILAPKFCAFTFLKSALRKLHLPISNFHFMESLNFASSQPPPSPHPVKYKDQHYLGGRKGGGGKCFHDAHFTVNCLSTFIIQCSFQQHL